LVFHFAQSRSANPAIAAIFTFDVIEAHRRAVPPFLTQVRIQTTVHGEGSDLAAMTSRSRAISSASTIFDNLPHPRSARVTG
jgi:hypothetical protein